MALLQQAGKGWARQRYGNDHGIALVTALMFVVALALVGSTTATVMTLSRQASGNYRASIQALEVAESGAEEARARLRGNAGTAQIVDTAPTQTGWQAYIGSLAQAQAYGYTSGSQRVDSLQTSLQYTVKIAHATDNLNPPNVLYWGDPASTGTNIRNIITGQNIYLVTSYGTIGGAHSTVQTQVVRNPPIPQLGALYVGDVTTVQGSSTNIIGQDQCGGVNRAGITTPLGSTTNGSATITQNGSPNITGTPAITYNHPDAGIKSLVNSLKGAADFSYNVTSATQSGNTIPGPGDNWGTPTAGATLQNASSCSEYHTVYYNTNNTYIHLTGGTTGCGVLLVDGDLELNGNFYWYGPVIVTGSVTYTGGGNKNTTGTILSGGTVQADVIGGNANLVYCSTAITKLAQTNPLLVLSWGTL